MRQFYFNTGVKSSMPNAVPGVNRGGTMQIPFQCDVPENATFMYACDNSDLDKNNPNVIVAEIHNSALLSKYAYFVISSKD